MNNILMDREITFEWNDQRSAREMVPEHIYHIMQKDKSVVFAASDSMFAGGSHEIIRNEFPERAIEAGIAECNLIGMASGMALSGKKVFVVAFGPFLSTRSMEMVYLDLAYNDAPVCVIGTHAGVTSGGGPTHNALIDMNNIRAMPNMILEAPADANQAIKAVDAFLDIGKPMYIRLARGSEPIVYATQDYDYEIGKAVMAKDGTDATIIACGVCVQKAVKAAMELENEGIHVRILDMHTIKPLDKKAVIQAARDTGRIITVEDHGIIGGLGTAVAEVIADNELNCRFKRLGVPDEFSTLGYPEEIYRHYGYNYTGIIRAVKELISIEE